MKKQTKRDKTKYPFLDPKLNLKIRYDEIDDLCDYSDQLSESEKEWLNAFSREEICAALNSYGIKLNNTTCALTRSRIYGRNNQRNRCVFSREKAKGSLVYMGEEQEEFLDALLRF